MKTRILSLVLLLVFSLSCTFANNIRIYDASDPSKAGVPQLLSKVEDGSIPENYYAIQFNLIWDNSWKSSNPRNWDAAWIFVKYNLGGTGWKHVWLADTGNSIPSGAKHGVATNGGFAKGAVSGQKPAGFTPIEYSIVPGYSYIPEKSKSLPVGVFLHRAKNGYGTVQFEKMRLFWDYNQQGLHSDDPVTVMVFAMEMVYVPGGEYRLGTGGTETNAFRQSYFLPSPADTYGEPFVMRSEDSTNLIYFANANGNINPEDSTYIARNNLGTTPANVASSNRVRIPKAFPKGTNPYYVMKYEITQEAYVDYLNTLNIQQQAARTIGTDPTYTEVLTVGDIGGNLAYDKASYRNGITLKNLSGTGTFVSNLNTAGGLDRANGLDDGQNIAMNYLSTVDWLSYLAWSGLRPLTEFEFEKACRGNQLPVKNEYAWGNTTYLKCGNAASTSTNPGYDNERPTPTGGNLVSNFNAGSGFPPLRVGSFADSATSRADAGASYWGIMELSGNVVERWVCAERESATMTFKGTHGYGEVDMVNASVPATLSWPTVYTGVCDYIFRGSGIGLSVTYGQVSDRTYAINSPTSTRVYYTGGRGGRTVNVSE